MKLRQVVLAADALEPARTILFDLFGIENAFVDPGVAAFGLTNSVMSIGDGFLEIVAPVEDGTAAGRLLERRGGTCGYMLIFQVEDFEATSGHLDALGVRKVWSFANDAVSACHVHPKDIGGAIVSFDEMRPSDEWLWGGPNWRDQRASAVQKVLGCTMQSPRPDALAARWASAFDRPLRSVAHGLRIDLDAGTFVEFVDVGDAAAREGTAAFEGVRGFTFGCDDLAALRARAERLGLDAERPSFGQLELSFVEV
jgi:hypothetical protein